MVDILLPVYNGSRFLHEQIQSILQQSFTDWKLLIRDDGSTDDTKLMIADYQTRYPQKIKVITDDFGNLGIANNALELLKQSTSEYIMFCDQDDVWLPDKVKKLFWCIKKAEMRYESMPLIVHCEALTTDEYLHVIKGNALMGYQSGFNKREVSFANLLLKNVVQGASMIFNQELRALVNSCIRGRISRRLVHDSVIASVASINGKILFYDKPLMYYRQHGNNLVGAKKQSFLYWNQYSKKQRESLLASHFLMVNHEKCALIKRNFGHLLSDREKEILNYFIKTPNSFKIFFGMGLNKEFSIGTVALMMVCKIR